MAIQHSPEQQEDSSHAGLEQLVFAYMGAHVRADLLQELS